MPPYFQNVIKVLIIQYLFLIYYGTIKITKGGLVMLRKYILPTLLLAVVAASGYFVSQSSFFDKADEKPKVVTLEKANKAAITMTAQQLFTKALNLGALPNDEEVKKTVASIYHNPKDYFKGLVDSKQIIELGTYTKISSQNTNEVVQKVGDGHYYYKADVILMVHQERGSQPVEMKGKVSMELKESKGFLKIVRFELEE